MNLGDLHRRVLILAHYGRDAELLCSFLSRNGFHCCAVNNGNLFEEIERGAAAAVIAEEAINGSWEKAMQRLHQQPPWSDFPLIVLTRADTSAPKPGKRTGLRQLGNVTLMERPIQSENLLSAVESAMRARARQYELRDYMRRQAEAEEALRRTEQLATAGRLAASIAHEINNPLEAVTNLLYLAKTSSDLGTAQRYSEQAEGELRRVSEIANQTLRFHRSESAPQVVEVPQLLESAVALFKAKLRGQQVEVKLQSFGNCNVVGSLGEIRQVLVNLMSNAIDAMRRGGTLTLRCSAAPHPRTGTAGVKITIADQGEGIRAEVRQRIFEAFFTTKGTVGTGLGLWLTRDIVERHRGFIRFRNHSSPHGAVFTVWLPQQHAGAQRRSA